MFARGCPCSPAVYPKSKPYCNKRIPAPNVGFTIKPGGRFTPSNTYAGRIGNTCTDKKKK